MIEGGQFRDLRMPRFAVTCVCAVVIALVVAPVAGAQSPAGDQYGTPIPSSGGDSGSSPTGTAPSSDSTVIPVAPSSDTSSADSTSTDTTGDTSGSSGKNDSEHKQGANHKSDPKAAPEANLTSGQPTSSHSVPQIAADSAGDSWVPFFIIGLVALASAFAFAVVLRNRRRRTAS